MRFDHMRCAGSVAQSSGAAYLEKIMKISAKQNVNAQAAGG
jgi:hypothetical protein